MADARIEEGEGLGNGLELVKSVTDKHLDHLRPLARYFSMFKGSDPVWCSKYLVSSFNTYYEEIVNEELFIVMIEIYTYCLFT